MPTRNPEHRGTDPARVSATEMSHERINSTNDFDISENILGYNALSYIGNDARTQPLNTDDIVVQPQVTQMRVVRNDFGEYSTFISGNTSLDIGKFLDKHRVVPRNRSPETEVEVQDATAIMSGAIGSCRSEDEASGRQDLDGVFNIAEPRPGQVSPSSFLRTSKQNRCLQLVAPTSHPIHSIVTT